MKNTKKTLMVLVGAFSCLILASCENRQNTCTFCNTTLTEENICKGVQIGDSQVDICESCRTTRNLWTCEDCGKKYNLYQDSAYHNIYDRYMSACTNICAECAVESDKRALRKIWEPVLGPSYY